MDKNANTNYFRGKFFPISFTLEEYNVSGFLSEYTEQVNTPICTGITTLTLDQ